MPNLHITGGARTAVEISARMVEHGHEFTILIPSGRGKLKTHQDVNVIECGLTVASPLLAVPIALMTMKSSVPYVDVVIGSMPPYALLAHNIGSERSIPSVNFMMSDDVGFFDDRTHIRNRIILSIYREIARRSIVRTEIITNSHWTAVKCIGHGGVRPMGIVPAGYDDKIFNHRECSDDFHNPTRIVTVGRKSEAKGFNDVVTGLNLVHKDRYKFELKVISQDDMDISRAEFPIHIDTPKSDLELVESYRWGDIFVYGSWSEGFGLPPLEAQACGLTVVSTDCGGVREYLTDGENCLMVPPRDPIEFSHAVKRVIDDGYLRKILITRGLQSCREFSWDKVADRFENTMKELIGDTVV